MTEYTNFATEDVPDGPRSVRGLLLVIGIFVFLGVGAFATVAFSETGGDVWVVSHLE